MIKEIMVENFPNLIKDMNLHIYEFQQTPSRINSVSQDTVKLLKDKNKEEILKASREKVTHRIQRSLNKINSQFHTRNYGSQKTLE